MGRPSKFTPERVQMIVAALAAGNTRTATAAAAGIGVQTFADWLRRFRDFRDAVTRAEAEAETQHVAVIKAAADGGDWRASSWWLERRCPETWGRRDKLEIISAIRDLARRAGLSAEDEARAVAEAEQVLAELRGGRGR